MTIKIAVAGHTNVGKTTLIRTLMRTTVGEVGDSPNLTKDGEFYHYHGLQATFIDTPGFQEPGLALLHLEGVSLPKKSIEELQYDLKAIEVIKQSDVVIYVGNLSIVADDSHKKEINIVKKIQPKVVSVLNQYNRNFKGSNSQEVNNRCRQWTELLNQAGIANVIVFDAHWDRRAKEKKIYDAIYEILDSAQKADFSLGLNKFKERQYKIRDEVCDTLVKSVENLQKIQVNVKKWEYDNTAKQEECLDKILRGIARETIQFIAYVNKLYESAAEYPTESPENLIVKTRNIISLSKRLALTANASAVLGTLGAVVGGIVGAVITAFLSGGLLIAIPLGAMEGAKIFGAAGASLATFTVFSDSDDRIDIRMTSSQIEDVVKHLLAIVWGLEHNCFGRDKNLSEDEARAMKSQIEELDAKLQELDAKHKIDDWTKVSPVRVINYCKDILNELENY